MWERATHNRIETRSALGGLVGFTLHVDFCLPWTACQPRALHGTPPAGPHRFEYPGAPLAPNTPPARGTPQVDLTCTICLGPIDTHHGTEPAFTWPRCGHQLPLGRVANLRAHSPRPTCPACRQPWLPETESVFQQRCSQHGIIIPDPIRHEHPAPGPAPAPPAPSNLLPLCCRRLILIDPAHAETDSAWRELPERHMQWAPVFNQRDQCWTPEWVCFRRNATCAPTHQHCPQHGPRTLALDL
jgi:hypothetical protein